MKQVLLLLFISAASGKQEDERLNDFQEIKCYEYVDLLGTYITLRENVPNLGFLDFDDRISSCCYHGVWILYAEKDYNDGAVQPDALVYVLWGLDYCSNLPPELQNKMSSLRYTGAPGGYRFDTVNLYDEESFSGLEQYVIEDTPLLNYETVKSVIVTGLSPWTLFEEEGFSPDGHSVCLMPTGDIELGPGFFDVLPGFTMGKVSSILKGCFSDNVVEPSTAPRGVPHALRL